MKQIVWYALTAGLVLGAGCSKENEDGTTERMSAKEVAVKTQETAVKVTEKAGEVTEKAAEVTKKAAATVTAVAVTAEDVMADLNKTVAQIKEKAAGFDTAQLMSYADSYKDVIIEKKEQLTGLADQLKGLSMTEMIGDKAQAIKGQLTQYTEQFNQLKERYSVYLDQLKALGADISSYSL